MEYALVALAAPIVIAVLDRLLYRGEFTAALLEAVHLIKPAAKKARKVVLRKSDAEFR